MEKAMPTARMIADAYVTHALLATNDTPDGCLYDLRKMTAHLRRAGHVVSIGTVDRLMRDEGLSEVLRGNDRRTTIPAKDRKRAGDLVDRNFTAHCLVLGPNRAWVADFTYCRTWFGFVYVSFIIDVFSRKIVGWHVMTTRPTQLVTVPLRMALWNRRHEWIEIFEGLLHHSDDRSNSDNLFP